MKKIIYASLLLSFFVACNSSNPKSEDEKTATNNQTKTTSTPTHKVTILKDDKPFMAFESAYSDFINNDGYFTMSLAAGEYHLAESNSILLNARNLKVGTFPISKGGLSMKEGEPRVVISEVINKVQTNAILLITEGTVTITSFDGKSISGSIKGTGNKMEDNSKLSIEATFNNVKITEMPSL